MLNLIYNGNLDDWLKSLQVCWVIFFLSNKYIGPGIGPTWQFLGGSSGTVF